MQVVGQLHAPGRFALPPPPPGPPPGKRYRYPLNRKLVGVQSRSERFEKDQPLPLSGTVTRFL